MSRKFVFGVVSVFGLMTLVVSAQQPAAIGLPQAERNPSRCPYCKGGHFRGRCPITLSIGAWRGIRAYAKTQELVKKLSKAEGDDKDKIKTQLTETLGKQFDVRQKRHEEELKALEAQVKKLKDIVDKRKENRREIIGRRFELLARSRRTRLVEARHPVNR